MKLGCALAATLVLAALGSAGTHAAGQAPNPNDFVAQVDNPWFPLVPGTTFVYRGVKDGKQSRDIFTVTHQTKLIQGIRCTAVSDRLFLAGRLGERTTDWYAQDRHGNVWYFGEDTMTFNRHGQVISREGSFRAGRQGARPGVYNPGQPRVGESARQEFFKGHAEDHFKVLDRHARVSVPYVTTGNALRTREWTPLEPGVVDNKFYVRGVGTVLENAVKGPTEKLRLVSFRRG
jgi:hypothetical protein